MLVSDSVTKELQLKLDSNRTLRRGSELVNGKKTVSDKHGKDSGLEGSPRQSSWHGYLLIGTDTNLW